MLQDHAFLSALGLASVWALVGAAQAPSYAAGALLGALYLVLLQKEADLIGFLILLEILLVGALKLKMA